MKKLKKDMTTEQLVTYIDAITKDYTGQSQTLFMAIGTLMAGRIYGWRVLRILLSSSSYMKYQRALKLEFKDVLPEETEYSGKSVAYKIVKKMGNFWDAVRRSAPLDEMENKSRRTLVKKPD
jgi:hypothetical protein